MTKLDEKLAPRPISGVDFKKLSAQPSAEDFFILSRVDGNQTIAQLCNTSGLGRAKTIECVSRLKDLGLIDFPGESTLAATSSTGETDNLGDEILKRFGSSFNTFQFDKALLSQEVELDSDFKREVLFVFSHLDELNYYELLGASGEANRRELRQNYFAMSKRYHPDRFFRKVLGSYEPMIDKIFQRITAAYQTLSNRTKRAEYDQILDQQRTSSVPAAPASTSSTSQDAKREMAFKLVSRRADEAFQRGSIDSAIGEYRKALSLKRDLSLVLRVTRQLLEAQRLDDALTFGRAAQKIAPTSVDALTILGEVYECKGRNAEAIEIYRQALSVEPEGRELKERLTRLQAQA